MAFYESVYIARQDLSPQQVEGLTELMTTLITDNGGKVEKTEQWGLRSIAYRIKKNRKGHYTQLSIDAPSAAIAELERQLGLHEDVLRSLTIRVDVIDMEPSPVLAAKSSRDERPRRDDRPRRDNKPQAPAPKPQAPAPASTDKKGDA